MENKAKQVILSSMLGDGRVSVELSNKNAHLVTSTIHKEYAEFKCTLLKEYSPNMREEVNQGYTKGKTNIYKVRTKTHKDLTSISKLSLGVLLLNLDYFGIALWFLDDGSYHKNYHFYNLCTHAFTREENEVICRFLDKKLGVLSVLAAERKKDGREFFYIRIPKLQGAHIISKIIRQYANLSCFSYKLMEEDMENEISQDWEQAFSENPFASYAEIKKEVVTIRKRRNALKGYKK